MSKVVGDIAIKVGADIGPLVRDMDRGSQSVNRFGRSSRNNKRHMDSFARAGAALGASAVIAATAMAALTKASMNNIDALSKQARAIGITVGKFQAMSHVANESGIETDAFGKMLVRMQRSVTSFGDGLSTQARAFDRLGVSIGELQGLNADQQFRVIADAMGKIKDPADRTATAMDIFGRAGSQAILMMEGYGSAVDKATELQAKFGITVSDFDAQQIEAANDAMARMGMAAEGVGNRLAVVFAPAIVKMADSLLEFTGRVTGYKTTLEEFFGTLQNARDVLGEDVFGKLLGDPHQLVENANNLDILADQFAFLSSSAQESFYALDGFAAALDRVGEAAAADVMRQYADELEGVRQAYEDGTIDGEEFKKKLEDIESRARDMITAFSDVNDVAFGGAVDALDKLKAKILEALVASQTLARAMAGDEGAAGPDAPYDPLSEFAPKASIRPLSAPPLLGEPDLDEGGGGGGRGGRGGGTNRLEAELERMRQHFAVEQDLLAEQQEQRMEKLREFRDAKLLTEQEYNDLEAQVKQEHEDKLTAIERAAREQRLQAVAGAFGDLSSLMQSENKKMFKIGQAAALAEATISGYKAAVEAWEKGMTVGGPPVAAAFTAASLAKTGMLISSIASASASGRGGGGGGGGSTASAAPAAPQERRVAEFRFMGGNVLDPRAIVDAMNDAYDQGYQIRGVLG